MKRLALLLLLLLLLVLPSHSRADMIVGGKTTYAIQKGDSLRFVASRVGLDSRIIAKENGLSPNDACRAGTSLSFNNRKIVPKVVQDGIIVNIPGRMLYYFRDGNLVSFFPVCLGGPETPTPVGSFVITDKRKNPTWNVPKSIQEEMERKKQVVKTKVLPGPKNPLGKHALHTSLSGILIHETIYPASIYGWRSHGCIRVAPTNMQAGFYESVPTGTSGEIMYQPVNVAVSEGRVYLQVDRDIYRKVSSVNKQARKVIEARGLADLVDWAKVERVTRESASIAEDVTVDFEKDFHQGSPLRAVWLQPDGDVFSPVRGRFGDPAEAASLIQYTYPRTSRYDLLLPGRL
jgi:L,D-transpeptidase ErfK/SrfK